ncbi:unnamed protein product [Mytilus coruscus]|uniref:Uncharacterized protein n=1 Tax=Mytilus coruscus TaxID=42192 RepID=A0A6J8BT93_MYTCO|nr:unnamed protein product [Mytilus coruscus]
MIRREAIFYSRPEPTKRTMVDSNQWNLSAKILKHYLQNPLLFKIYEHSDSEHGHEEERTHANTIELARIARANMADGKKKYAEKGVKGMSWGFSLPNFDIINSMCLDYMLAVLLGVMKRLLNFWFEKDKNEFFSISNRRSEVEQRLTEIKPPNNITSAVWLLLQQEIRKDDLDNAAKHFEYFCYQMSALYGDASNSFSVHLLLHIPNTVLQNEPLWCQSCFWFEDYNSEMRQFFHSSQHPDSQVARAVHIVQKLPEMVKIMNPESAAAILQRKMTKKYVQRGISVVGKAEEANLADHENVFPLVKLAKPSFTGITLKYKRALLQGEMIHSKIYQKVSQRNSFTVEYQNLTDKEYGEILFFLGLDDDYLAVVNKFTKKKCALTEDHTTGPSGGHLLTFEKQRFALGVGWRPSTLCSIGWKCTISKSNLKGTITKEQSIFLKKYHHVLLGIGSGVCSRCRKELVQRMADKENRVEPYPSDSMDSYCNVEVSESANAEFIMEDTREEISQNDAYGEVTQCKQTAQGAKKAALQIDEENLQTGCISMDSMDDCISETVYSQSSQYSEWQDSQESPSRKRKIALNTFLETVDISPVKKTLTVDFDLASERTKNDYVRKAKRIMNSVLGILVPQQESLLEEVLYDFNACKDKTLESFSKAYSSMSSWGTQRQILSLLVQDYSYNQLKDYIPDLSIIIIQYL